MVIETPGHSPANDACPPAGRLRLVRVSVQAQADPLSDELLRSGRVDQTEVDEAETHRLLADIELLRQPSDRAVFVDDPTTSHQL